MNGKAADLSRIENTGRGTDWKGRILVLNMIKFGHDRQLSIRMWSLRERGQRERHVMSESLPQIPSIPSHFCISSGPA